jgi:hypothetical protein
LDLYVGYDEQLIKESSCDYTTFQTPFGALQLITLPMGWMNSVPIFHNDVTYILQPEIPNFTIPYIDNVPIKGPPTWYIQSNSSLETIAENQGICCFVWEHFQMLNRIMQQMKYSRGTFSGYKSMLCIKRFWIISHYCTPAGCIPDDNRISVIQNWGPCQTISKVQAFLGMVRLVHIFIHNYAHCIFAINKLTKKDKLSK